MIFCHGASHAYNTNTPFFAGVAVVLGTKKEIVTEVGTETESATENVTEKILLVGIAQDYREDTESVPGVERGIRNAHGNGNGTEITETDTADFVSFPLMYTSTFTF